MRSKSEQRDDYTIERVLRSSREMPPQLSAARLEFERRRLMARLSEGSESRDRDPSRGLLRPALAMTAVPGLAAALLLFLLLPLNTGNDAPDISLVGEWQLRKGDAISAGAEVSVPATGTAALVLADGTDIRLAPGTRFSVRDGKGAGILLKDGHLLARVPRRDKKNPFSVEVNGAVVKVLGTVFSVNASMTTTDVRLYQGQVQVTRGEQDVTISPGQRVRLCRKGELRLDSFGPDLVKDDLFAGGPGEEDLSTVARNAGAALFQNEFQNTNKLGAAAKKLEDKTAGRDAQPRKGVPTVGRMGSVKRCWNKGQYDKILQLTERHPGDPRLGYYRAKAFCRLGRFGECAEAYLRIADMDPASEGEMAYLSADAFDRAGQFAKSTEMARRAIDSGGPNADHAFRLLMRGQIAAGRTGEAAGTAREYLGRYPGGAHVAEAHFVEAAGLRNDGQFVPAMNAYGKFLRSGIGSLSMRDDAGFYYGYCAIRAGKLETGRRAMESYLATYPGGRHADTARKILLE